MNPKIVKFPFPLPEPLVWVEYHVGCFAVVNAADIKAPEYFLWAYKYDTEREYKSNFSAYDTNENWRMYRVAGYLNEEETETNILAYFDTLDEALRYMSARLMLGVME